MFNSQLANLSEVTIIADLSITEDEMIWSAVDYAHLIPASGSIQGTIFNVVKALLAGSSNVPVTVDFVEGALYNFMPNMFTRKQIANALAGLRRSGKLWRYQNEPGYFLPSPELADYDRAIK